MRSSRFIIFTLALALLALTAAGALACDKKGASAASAKGACCQKAAADGSHAAACCKKGTAAKTAAAADCPHAAAKTASAGCIGKTASGASTVSIESQRVSPTELQVDYLGTDAKSVDELTQAAGAPLAEFPCHLVQEMAKNDGCQVKMEATEEGVRFTVHSDEVAMLDGFAKNYERAMSGHAAMDSKPAPEDGQEQGI